MKNLINVSIPIVLTISLVLLLNAGSSSIYGQILGQTNQTNQTGGQNTTQQAQQQLDQANQQMQQAQQQKQQAQQQLEQSNQTQQQQTNQSKQQDPMMNEKLLNYTNAAILALNDDNTSAAQDNLVQIQNALINASGKQVVVIPAPAVSPDEED
jgi:acetate kinase